MIRGRMLLPPIHPVRPIPLPIADDLQPLVLQAVFFTLLLAVASAIDARRRIIPNTVCVGIALAGLVNFSPANLFGVLTALPFLIAAMCKHDSIGGGDIKLVAACGFVLGFTDGIAGLCIGLIALLVFYEGSQIAKRMKPGGRSKKTKSLPMAPFLSIGFTLIYILKITGL